MNIGTIVTAPEIIWLQKRFFMKLPTLKEVGGFMAPPKIEESENSFNGNQTLTHGYNKMG